MTTVRLGKRARSLLVNWVGGKPLPEPREGYVSDLYRLEGSLLHIEDDLVGELIDEVEDAVLIAWDNRKFDADAAADARALERLADALR